MVLEVPPLFVAKSRFVAEGVMFSNRMLFV